jgi:hypothetical protein
MRGVVMGRRGRRRQLLVEGEYWRLLLAIVVVAALITSAFLPTGSPGRTIAPIVTGVAAVALATLLYRHFRASTYTALSRCTGMVVVSHARDCQCSRLASVKARPSLSMSSKSLRTESASAIPWEVFIRIAEGEGSMSGTADWFARSLGSASLVLSGGVAGTQAWFHYHRSRDLQAWPLLEPLQHLCEGATWVADNTIIPSKFLAARYIGPLELVRAQVGRLKDKTFRKACEGVIAAADRLKTQAQTQGGAQAQAQGEAQALVNAIAGATARADVLARHS